MQFGETVAVMIGIVRQLQRGEFALDCAQFGEMTVGADGDGPLAAQQREQA